MADDHLLLRDLFEICDLRGRRLGQIDVTGLDAGVICVAPFIILVIFYGTTDVKERTIRNQEVDRIVCFLRGHLHEMNASISHR